MELNEMAKKWQKRWEDAKIFKVNPNSKKKKYYVLEMFPYPSASFLHMGHVRNYAIGDVIARFKRMQGFNVLYPMGYDSFGLPAENAAKKEGINPKQYTERSIKAIMQYQKELGNSYDWDRVIATHEPQYFKWNQYFFEKFLEKGLVYRKKAPINWCPDCASVLANEEVVNGCCWRHENTPVEQKELEQWFLKITAYAEELLNDIDALGWSDRIKHLQKNWIGKSEGTLVDFQIKGSKNKLQVFTTRPDTIHGVTFVTVSPKHALISELVKKNQKELEEFSRKVQTDDEKEKEGIFLGSYVINPYTGDEVPVYAANFVVAEYGTGAVMAVPAHDTRDFDFAKKYNLPIKTVIVPKDNKKFVVTNEAYVDDGVLVNSKQFDGIDSNEAIDKISEYGEKNKFAKKTVQFKIRDWLISRQRYWGTPIPIVYCKDCGAVPVPEKDLPLKLPPEVDFKVTGNPLNHIKDWVETKCPKCNKPAKRETDTMGGFVDSSWYFLRYCSPKTTDVAFDKKEVDYWMPVDQYIGGIEHAVGHLMYSRFFTKVLRDLGYVSINEPFTRLFNQGIVYKDGHKMSKSFGNVVYQTDISNKYGIDTARLFTLFLANPESDMEWSDQGVEGSHRMLQRIVKIPTKFATSNPQDEHKRNLAIKNYTELISSFKFNIAVVELMKYVDYLSEHPTKQGYEDLLKMLAPIAPHTAEELWEQSGHKSFISLEKWPTHDDSKISSELEALTSFSDSIKNDIRGVLKLAKIENPKKITLFVSDVWKYELYNIIAEELKVTRSVSDIMKKVMGSELKKHGQDIQKLLPKLCQTGVSVVVPRELEYKSLKDSVESLVKEFNAPVVVMHAEESTLPKAKNASPGKPAILVE